MTSSTALQLDQIPDVLTGPRTERPAPQRGLFQGSRGIIKAIAAFSAIANLLLLTVPFYTIQLFDRVLSSNSYETLVMLTIVAVGCLIFYGIFELLRTRLLVRLGASLEQEYGGVMLTRELQGGTTPDGVASRPLQDLREVAGYVGSASFVNLLDAPWCPVFVIIIFLINPVLGWIALVAALLFIAVGLISDRMTKGFLVEARAVASLQNETSAEFRRNAELARAMGLVPNLVARWEMIAGRSLRANINSGDRVGALSSIARCLRLMVQVALMGVGVALVLRQELTPGVLIATSLLLARALAPLEQSIGAVRAFAAAQQAHQRLTRELAEIDREADKMRLADPRGQISAEGVGLRVEGRKAPIVEDIAFDLAPGEVLAMIGPSGSGKSTLLRMIAGLQPFTAGSIRIDGTRVADWHGQQIGERIGYLPQDIELMTGTIAENISGLSPDLVPASVLAAAKAANLEELVQQLPKGFNTVVGPYGVTLSGGQRQRVALARAFHGDRRILLLDEPDAHLDDDGQQKLARAIKQAKAHGTTVIFTSHRRSMLAASDKLLVLINGRVSHFGDTASVIATMAGGGNGPPAPGRIPGPGRTPQTPAPTSPKSGRTN